MSAISIVINAVNNAKAAFTSVGNQVVDLNKKLNKAAGVMRSLFAVGIVAKFVKDLVGASSETEKLEGIVSRIKEKFGDAATTIGDGIVGILGAIEPVILKVGDFLNFLIDGIKRVAATATALLMGEGFKDAVNIADEVLAAEKAERAARIEAKKTAEEKKKLDKEVADNSIKEAERVAREKEKLAQEIAKLEKDIADQQNKMAEAQMSDAEILAKRKEESEKAYNDYVTALLEGRTKDQLEAFNQYLKLQEEIMKMESDIAEEAKKTAEELAKQTEEKKKQLEEDKKKAQEQANEEGKLKVINRLEELRTKLLEKQAQLLKLSEDKRLQAVDKGARKEAKEQDRAQAKEQRRFDNLLKNAKRIQEENAKGGLQRSMSEAERLALESAQAGAGANMAGQLAQQAQKGIEDIQSGMATSLDSIDKNIVKLLELKG
jgi:DNA repair exonuclease SbcCD ATPase subunit